MFPSDSFSLESVIDWKVKKALESQAFVFPKGSAPERR